MNKIELNSCSESELRSYIESLGEKSFRGTQLFSYFNSEKKYDLLNIDVLPKSLREKLDDVAIVRKVKIHEVFESQLDETKKILYELEDKNLVEGVLMSYKHGYSLCVSTQVGCKMGCSFCASTKGGLIRDLSAAEMLNQVYEVEKYFCINISNIILMGSGEPLDNFDNVISFLKILHDPKGKNMSYRNMTISTCGIVPQIYKLAEEELPITLAISLHSIYDDMRSEIMPINKKYDLNELLRACKDYSNALKSRITFEYTLIEGVNDKRNYAEELAQKLRNINCHVNLIPLNPIEEFNQKRPDRKNIKKFEKMLKDLGINVTIRRELGSDISASCGQLRRKHINGKKEVLD